MRYVDLLLRRPSLHPPSNGFVADGFEMNITKWTKLALSCFSSASRLECHRKRKSTGDDAEHPLRLQSPSKVHKTHDTAVSSRSDAHG